MSYILEELIPTIEAIHDDPNHPRQGLLSLKKVCEHAIQELDQDDPFAPEVQKLQSTVWMIERLTETELGFDRWLLFALRAKKSACTGIITNYLRRTKTLMAA